MTTLGDGRTEPRDRPMPTGRLQYSENLRRSEKAASYNTKYERELHKRISDRREKRLLERILRTVGRQDTLLDVPCGAGRLSPVLARFADRVYEVDYSHEILKLCRANAPRGNYRPILANGTALSLPFGDQVFDLVASIRLSHHLPAVDDRLAHVRELCRVSRRYVLLTFFASESLKNRMRSARRMLGSRKRGKYTLHTRDVERAAGECGLHLRASWALAPFFSGHYFALLERG